MIAIARSAEPPDLALERQRRLARLLLEWHDDRVDPADPEAIAAFVASRKSWLNSGYGRARAMLLGDQHRKCAYCERKIDPSAPIDHHRPRRPERAGNPTSGPLVHAGYFWLTWSYGNLLLACNTCNGAKGNRYPISEQRAEAWGDTALEAPLWIDPSREDPSCHVGFVFDEVLGKWSVVGLTARGRAMIHDLHLWRHDADWQGHLDHVERLVGLTADWSAIVDVLLAPDQPYRALTRAWLAARFDEGWCRSRGVRLPDLPTTVHPDTAPLWIPRPDLAPLSERLQLWIRALGDNPITRDLDEALCAFVEERAWAVAELTHWLPRSEGVICSRLEALAKDGALAFDGQWARPKP